MESSVKYLSARNRTKTETAQCRFKSLRHVAATLHPLHDPADQIPNRFLQQRTATLANRRQFHASPVTHTRFIQFPYQKTVRQEHAVRVSGLTHAVQSPNPSKRKHGCFPSRSVFLKYSVSVPVHRPRYVSIIRSAFQ